MKMLIKVSQEEKINKRTMIGTGGICQFLLLWWGQKIRIAEIIYHKKEEIILLCDIISGCQI